MPSITAGAPGGLFFLPPGASFGADVHHSTIELKGAITSLVHTPIPGTLLVHPDGTTQLEDHHLTIHDNLMVHLKHRDGSTLEIGSAISNGQLDCDALHLVTLAAAPPAATQPQRGRFQRKWDGGSAIIPLMADADYHAAFTYLLVDIWATRTGFNAAGQLPGPRRGTRAATTIDGSNTLGPVPAEWGFRKGSRPDCAFHFRFWFAEVVEFGGAPFITTRTKRRFEKSEAYTAGASQLEYEIRGHKPHVSFQVGPLQFRLTPDEAKALADSVEMAKPIEIEGTLFVPIAIAQVYAVYLPTVEAVKVPGYLRSAAKAALEEA